MTDTSARGGFAPRFGLIVAAGVLLLLVAIVKLGWFGAPGGEAPVGEENSLQTVAVEGPKGTPEELLAFSDEIWSELVGLIEVAESEEFDQMLDGDVEAVIEGLQKARYVASGVPADQRPVWFGSLDARLAAVEQKFKMRSIKRAAAAAEKPTQPIGSGDKLDTKGQL